jgi:predicted AlkP superfamily phosphohydrolase/phosphomutase
MSMRWKISLLLLAAVWLGQPGTAEAYVGPGAGFAFLGSFATLFLALAAALLSLFTWPVRFVLRSFRRRKALKRAKVKRMIILGLDGLDPGLCERWMADGELPNLSAMARNGSFQRLRTTYPSISPVAWSSFMTGVDPARHNVFDFLNRDVRTYKPHLSSSQVESATRTLQIGDWLIPLSKPAVRNMRKSRAFWSILGDHRIPSHVLRVPLTFPPEKFAGALLSAMCVPDLRGTQGAFTFYTTNPAEVRQGTEAPEGTGGERMLVELIDDAFDAVLPGPENSLRVSQQTLEVPFSLKLDRAKRQALLRIGKKKYTLREREYSPWIRVTFNAGLGIKAHGIARFYITRMDEQFGLYVTPINIDPGNPALPISYPAYFSVYLSKLIGEFATLGLAEDTWALNEGVIDEDAFLQQALDHHEEREKMFFNALEKAREGVVACVFDGTDRVQHMFYRYLEDDHPANKGRDLEPYRDVILNMYKQCDEMVGRVAADLKPGDHFIVLSDHGFGSFRRGVNLNSWLKQEGLLHLEDGASESGDWFESVDWSRTKAYAFGLGGIYLNLAGREAQGIVEPGDDEAAVKLQIQKGLGGMLDEENGEIAINEIFDNRVIHPTGPYRDSGPDLIVGYNRGYRASWEGAVGRVTEVVLMDNTKAWSGDHCVDPRLVPGVLFSNRPMRTEDPGIMDLAPTILTQFGVDPPAHMTGKTLSVETGDTA